MAKKGRRKKMTWVPVNISLALGTLGSDTVLSTSISTLSEDFYAVGAKGVWTLSTLTAGEGPIHCGFAHDDYSVAEIEECLDAGASFAGPGSKIEQEQSRRLVRQSGAFAGQLADDALDGGEVNNYPLRFMINSGHGLAIYAYNQSGGNLQTGAILRFSGHVYGNWKI